MTIYILIFAFVMLIIFGILNVCDQHGYRGLALFIIALILLMHICKMI